MQCHHCAQTLCTHGVAHWATMKTGLSTGCGLCWDFVARPSSTLYSHALAGCAHLVVACSADFRMPAGGPVLESIDVTHAWLATFYVPRVVCRQSVFESHKLNVTTLFEDTFYGTVCCSMKFREQSAN